MSRRGERREPSSPPVLTRRKAQGHKDQSQEGTVSCRPPSWRRRGTHWVGRGASPLRRQQVGVHGPRLKTVHEEHGEGGLHLQPGEDETQEPQKQDLEEAQRHRGGHR